MEPAKASIREGQQAVVLIEGELAELKVRVAPDTPTASTGVRLAIRGYAKLDVIQDLDYVGDRFGFYVPSIPVQATREASIDRRRVDLGGA